MKIAAPEKRALFLRHLAEQFFENSEDCVIEASSKDSAARVTVNGNTALFDASGYTWLDGEHRERLALGRAFAAAADPPCPPPYGILTGVRPVKMALKYLGIFGDGAAARLSEDYLVRKDRAKLLSFLAEKERALEKTVGSDQILLYVSIPFCPTRCAYCSFISAAAPGHTELIDKYLGILKNELSGLSRIAGEKGLRVRAAYVGGGTPGILTPPQLEELLDAMYRGFGLEGAEVTAELGRPDVITAEKLDALKSFGVRRVCVNPQTTDDRVLKLIGRSHSASDFFDAYRLAASRGFGINCDLIAGLPGDSPEGFQKSLREVEALGPEDITVHSFCLKNGARGGFSLPPSSQALEMLDFSASYCISRGYLPYYLYRQKNASGALENLGWAKPGAECLYNVMMMEDMLPVFAAGAGSISKLFRGGKVVRAANHKYPFEYISDPAKLDANLGIIGELSGSDRN